MKKNNVTSLALTLSIIGLSACTTIGTQKRVLTEPMTSDLEAQVLRETGISGAATGAVTGAALAGGSAFGISMLSGASTQQAATNAAVAGTAGGVAGGVVGYQEGKKKGQAMVGQAISRDQAQRLLKGAKSYNMHLSNVNSSLRKALKNATAATDEASRKATIQQIASEANAELTVADKRLDERKKAIQREWASASDKNQFAAETKSLTAYRNELVQIVSKSKQNINPLKL